MAASPDPSTIFERAVDEGERRLDQSLIELLSSGFIAGGTIIFGIVALGIVRAMLQPHFSEVAPLAGALAFGIGVVFLVVGRAELFSENFFDPVATAVDRRNTTLWLRLIRLWAITLVLNLIGGAILAWILAVDGVLPEGTAGVLRTMAEELAGRGIITNFAKALVGGSLVTLLSFFLRAVNDIGSRIVMAYSIGFLLALGPFEHVIVTILHLVFGLLFDAKFNASTLLETGTVVLAGNLIGGLGLVTLTHITQAEGARHSGH